ncbi:MAG: PhnD/SsuA/transferrin family substrate-binding protein [Acidimicrobiales bacterium]|nr:PhnD/SsuA/transferrin family substrate-binding protein [Acidimicrobiales bacterium]MCB9394193.1 PhnD/SsuA/transferrin family substrate-binding protein [Acidimicrobiaceae bacterium]
MNTPTRESIAGEVSLAMYPLAEVRDAWDHLWWQVHRRAPWLPDTLGWPDDPPSSWRSPDLVVGQTCAWPLMTELVGRVRVVGSFAHDVPDAVGPTYRSVLVARRAAPPASFAGGTAAVNDRGSLSGWVSLIHAVHGPRARWEGEVRLTGAHVDSIRAVRDGDADIASIDAVTWWLVSTLRPSAVAGLAPVGQGPRVPCLPVVVGAAVPDDALAELRVVLDDAVRDEGFRDDRRRLALRGFVGIELDQYRPVLELSPAPDA